MATSLGLPYLPAYSHGGAVSGPRLIVVHSTESGTAPGTARSLAGPNWFGGPAPGTSAHIISDPSGAVEMVHDDLISWNCGPGGNGISWGAEHCGRAGFTAAEWRTPAMLDELRHSAQAAAKVARAHGIPIRWLSIAQLRAGAAGFCSHNDIRLAFGETTHTDPGPNFPYAEYLTFAKGGAVTPPSTDWFDMASKADLQAVVQPLRDQITALQKQVGTPGEHTDQSNNAISTYGARVGAFMDGQKTDQAGAVASIKAFHADIAAAAADRVVQQLSAKFEDMTPAGVLAAMADPNDPVAKRARAAIGNATWNQFGEGTTDVPHKLRRTDAYYRDTLTDVLTQVMPAMVEQAVTAALQQFADQLEAAAAAGSEKA